MLFGLILCAKSFYNSIGRRELINWLAQAVIVLVTTEK